MKTVLFLRHYRGFTGGHLKMLHYVEHVMSSGIAVPRILLTPASVMDDTNIFLKHRELIVDAPVEHDLLVLGGLDWQLAEDLKLLDHRLPVINIIQSTRHANSDDPRSEWLGRFATRICVGQEIAAALHATGKVNGPVHVITNGLEPLDDIRRPLWDRSVDVVVAGSKDKALARATEKELHALSIKTDTLTSRSPREEYLNRVARAKIAILLPHLQEGSYLPALEAMALDVAVVCPDTPGVHSFCIAGTTALLPPRDAVALAAAAQQLLKTPELGLRLRAKGREVAKHYTLERERLGFHSILAELLDRGRLPAIPK